MKKTRNLFIIAYGVIAVLVLAGLWCATFQRRAHRLERQAPRIVVMGDSIVGQQRDDTSVTAVLSELLGEPVFNGALGGTCMSRIDRERRIANTKEGLSMVSFSKSIVSDDFGVQQTVRSRESATEYFADTIDALECIDFGQVEILVIEHMVNDYHTGVPIDNPQNPYDEYSYCGALRSTIRGLQRKYPDLRVVLLTPTYTWYTVTNLTCEEFYTEYGNLEDYVNAQLGVAQEMGVEVVDVYHNFYPHEEWNDWQIYSEDGLHPNEAGRALIARALAERITGGSSERKAGEL